MSSCELCVRFLVYVYFCGALISLFHVFLVTFHFLLAFFYLFCLMFFFDFDLTFSG